MTEVSQLYPEYYILKVNDFNKVAKTPLEEWIYYLNTGQISENAQAPGLEAARERLKLDRMTKDELSAYYRHLDNIVILKDNIFTERAEGRAEGHAEGLAEGRAEGLAEGRAEGLAEGRAEGHAAGLAEGRAEGVLEGEKKKAISIAKELKAINMDLSQIASLTGIPLSELQNL